MNVEEAVLWLKRYQGYEPFENGIVLKHSFDLTDETVDVILSAIGGANIGEPLTLEQLREMDGEPVWIVDVGPHKWYGPGWAIVDRDNCLVRTAKNWNPVFFERYGERWLAYRRPPEGEE